MSTLSGISTGGLDIPATPGDNATPSEILEYSKEMFLFAIRYGAIDKGINTVGNAELGVAKSHPTG